MSTGDSKDKYAGLSQPVIPISVMLDTRLKVLAQRIDALIKASTYSPADIARLLDVDPSAVSRWMNGTRTPTMKNLLELAELLNVEMADLWTGEEAIPATPEQRAAVELMKGMSLTRQQALIAMLAADQAEKNNGK